MLRLSRELGPAAESALDREAAQQMWEALQLRPEEIIASHAQLREATARALASAQQAQAARAEAVQLQAQLKNLEETRWQHPLVYGAGSVLLGVGWLWLSERKKRIASQEYAAQLMTDENSVLAMPEGPSTPPVSEPSYVDVPTSIASPVALAAESITKPEALPIKHNGLQPFSEQKETIPLHFERPTPWWKFGKPKPLSDAALSASSAAGLDASENSNNAQIQPAYPDEPYEGTTELEDMHAPDVPAYAIELANAPLLTQTRLKPNSSEDAMGHLLEIRMAVQTLVLLGQHSAALKLLGQHIDEVPNTCAWAYMEYLDLSSILGQRVAFEAMRKRYRLQFNRLAPYWMEPNGSVQTLDSYERPMAELCSAWPSLQRTRELIATWLQGTLHSRRLFQRPAYHDLFDLYEMLDFLDDQSPAAQDFVPTVSLLDLDYEFAVEVKIDPDSNDDALRAIPTVKTGKFDVDFNLTQGATEMGALLPTPDTPKAARSL